MPLLGKKLFTIGAISPQKDKEDWQYFIPHTKERFQSKSEYEKRKSLYEQKIWTCRATGHTNLSHEEACNSEKTVMKQLGDQFPKCFEKDILEIVHHNTVSLENLVDKAWLKLQQQFIVGEKVNLKVKFADKLIPAKVIAIDSNLTCKEVSSPACNSPSSDKENSTEEKDKESPKKWVPPKMLPYTYSIELENEAKVIHSVPGSDLHRVEKAPSKDVLRHFIRVSALRSGNTATSPWVVNTDLVKQYKLVNKFADFFLSPLKMSEAIKKAEENGKKRKLSNGATKSAAKKLKLDKSLKKDKKLKNQESTPNTKKELNGTKDSKSAGKNTKVSPKKKACKDSAIIIANSDSEDEVSLAKLKRSSSVVNSDSDSDVPLYQLVDQTTPKKKKKSSEVNVSSDEDIPLSKITPSSPKKSTPKITVNSTPKKKTSLSKSMKKISDKSTSKKSNKKKKILAEEKKKGGMKQVTLFDLTKKGKIEQKSKISEQKTPQKKSPAKTPKSPPRPPPTPAIVKRLLCSKRETLQEKMKYSMLLKKAVSVLSAAQVKNLPEKLKGEVEHKKKLMEEKEKMAKMTQEEREAYLKEKREQAKIVQKQKLLQKLRDQRKRFEDTDLDLTPLPQAKLVPTPDSFPNSLFGDVAMVTEFINSYSGLLMPESEYPIYTDALMKALVGGSSGFAYLSRVLNVLLQTLLQDQIAKGYKEFNTLLSDIAVSSYTASELVRLCLQCEDEDDDVEDVPEEYIRLLKDSEFYQLDVEQKLCVLHGLCSRVLATYSVQDYMEEQQRKVNVLTKQKNTELKQMAAQKKTGKQGGFETKNEKLVEKNEKVEDNKDTKNGSLTITSFYGKEAADITEESDNLISTVKSRRLLAAKAAAEKERLERERMALREKEIQEEKQKEKLRKKQEQMADAINLARMVLRCEPIGTDRHHDRYWVFTNTTPGLYVEKGWVGEEINYNIYKKTKSTEEEEEEEESSESEEETDIPQTGDTPLKLKYRTKKQMIETSTPHPGQNMWFTYRSQKDLDGLLKALHPQGIRESLLKAEIKKRYDDISRAIIMSQRTNLELRDSDGDVEMVEGFKKELSDMELRLRNGGLGGVKDYDEWEATLMKATEISELGLSLLRVHDGILEKFLQGFMKPSNRVGEGEKKQDSETEDKQSDGECADKPQEKEDKREKVIREWKEAVENCQTLSRLHVLMAFLDSCIKWEKSAENAKCKICRKKCDDARLLLCDECNQAFHMYCLRPALNKLPSGDWFCPACKPRRPQERVAESESEADEEEREDACRECGGKEKLIFCSKCPAAFHTQCHDPPLRHPPRGSWECTDCKNGVNERKRGKLSRKVAPKRNYRQALSASEEEEESTEEEEEVTPARSKRSSSNKGRTRNKVKKRSCHIQDSTTSSRSRSSTQKEMVTPTHRVSRRGPSELSLCEEVLQKVMKHKSSWPFLEPVDKKIVPDYYVLIKKPMDFQTMMKKCARLSYASPQEFIEDAALVFENAESYNKPDSEVYHCMKEVEKVFREALHKVLPDWPFYRTVNDREESSSGSETGRRRSRNK
ncbi:tyrosine-protein kinase BAZ1B-like [Biomphalaria glabrata]|uniref:Tyrosine-protein kinase BAZ1B n=1 Tax=Biomphalaria glabrata TaxID=6526 RepID=A0A9W3BIT6_BIOGL|nr:tyrosine-protein kinase BAZ1B-like [Biomphalaria glabrata]